MKHRELPRYGGAIGPLALALILASCNGDGNVTDTGPKGTFPVDEAVAAGLAAKGVPSDAARWFASAKVEASGSGKDYGFRQTFPNGATREIAFKVTPDVQYAPTAVESAQASKGADALYGIRFKRSATPDSAVSVDLAFFVPQAGVPEALRKRGATGQSGAESGSGMAWGETAKAGADVGIGSVLDYYKDKGLPVQGLGNIYALASAISAIGGAAVLAQQNTKWLKELAYLEHCAANPTNPVAKSDPDYIRNAVGKVQSARAELQEVNTVRFLNQMTETGAGITPVTAALAAALKQGFIYSERTLEQYSEETIMREARLAVDSCKEGGELAGNVDVLWQCLDEGPSGATTTIAHTVAAVQWNWDPNRRMFVAQGQYTHKRTQTASGGGRTCTYTETAEGAIAGSGSLMMIDDVALQNVFGFGYSAEGQVQTTGQWTDDCRGTSGTVPLTISWLPYVTGYPGTGGAIEGERTKPVCIGATLGSEVTKFAFEVPAAE